MSKQTKPGNLSSEFLRKAVSNPEGALAVMFFAAFGVDLGTIMSLVDTMIANKDRALFIMCMDAAVQIRNHVVFVGRDYGKIREKYPVLIIEGQRAQQDVFNFSALHAMGHVICHCSTSTWAAKSLSKAGSCITGNGTNEGEAGKINKELSQSWAATDLAAFSGWSANAKATSDGLFNTWFGEMIALKAAYNTKATTGASTKASAAGAAALIASKTEEQLG